MTHMGWEFYFDPNNWFRPFGPRGRRGSHRRSRRVWFGSGDMKYVILELLKGKPMHGYEVMKALEEQTCGCYSPSPGTVYPTLQWLEDEGLVELEVKDGKKVYSVTDSGRDFLDENRSTVKDIFDRVSEMIDRLVDDPGPDISRAVGRLVGQTYRAAWRNGGDRERKEAILKILDDATDKMTALDTRGSDA